MLAQALAQIFQRTLPQPLLLLISLLFDVVIVEGRQAPPALCSLTEPNLCCILACSSKNDFNAE